MARRRRNPRRTGPDRQSEGPTLASQRCRPPSDAAPTICRDRRYRARGVAGRCDDLRASSRSLSGTRSWLFRHGVSCLRMILSQIGRGFSGQWRRASPLRRDCGPRPPSRFRRPDQLCQNRIGADETRLPGAHPARRGKSGLEEAGVLSYPRAVRIRAGTPGSGASSVTLSVKFRPAGARIGHGGRI